MIAEVILWQNGVVMVQDEHGKQMPDYQGRVEDVAEKVLKDAPRSVNFQLGTRGAGAHYWLDPLTRNQFAARGQAARAVAASTLGGLFRPPLTNLAGGLDLQ